MRFIKAEWRKLIVANYQIDPSLISDLVPPGTQIAFFNEKCYVSLVGFMFLNTQFMGVKVPYHTHFEEVNFRFYVKRWHQGNWHKGVVFIKEIVPKAAITFIANNLFKKYYQTIAMDHLWENLNNNPQRITYQWQRNGKWHEMKVEAFNKSTPIPAGSEEEFILENYYGFAGNNEKESLEYEVKHPPWSIYQVNNHEISVDFRLIYGSNFDFLTYKNPDSVYLAEGSEVSVENKKKIN